MSKAREHLPPSANVRSGSGIPLSIRHDPKEHAAPAFGQWLPHCTDDVFRRPCGEPWHEPEFVSCRDESRHILLPVGSLERRKRQAIEQEFRPGRGGRPLECELEAIRPGQPGGPAEPPHPDDLSGREGWPGGRLRQADPGGAEMDGMRICHCDRTQDALPPLEAVYFGRFAAKPDRPVKVHSGSRRGH